MILVSRVKNNNGNLVRVSFIKDTEIVEAEPFLGEEDNIIYCQTICKEQVQELIADLSKVLDLFSPIPDHIDVVSTYAEENNISRSEAFRKLYSQECIPSDEAERIKTKT